MFLRSLNNEQKKLFLNLAIEAASANDVIEENEKIFLEAYADEMGICVHDVGNSSMEEVCVRLKDISNSKELNQIAFEIVGMMVSDSEYDKDEKLFISKMATIFYVIIPIHQILFFHNEECLLLTQSFPIHLLGE